MAINDGGRDEGRHDVGRTLLVRIGPASDDDRLHTRRIDRGTELLECLRPLDLGVVRGNGYPPGDRPLGGHGGSSVRSVHGELDHGKPVELVPQIEPVRHEHLRNLVIETGGLSADVVRAVAASDLPALTDLELWLGAENYGSDSSVADLAPILAGEKLPRLTRLALSNSEYEDAIAAAVATAQIVPQLRVLDLSKGVLLDSGAEALLAGQSLTHLESLDLHHNYLSDAVRTRVRAALEPAGVALLLDGENAEENEYDGTIYRSVAVGE